MLIECTLYEERYKSVCRINFLKRKLRVSNMIPFLPETKHSLHRKYWSVDSVYGSTSVIAVYFGNIFFSYGATAPSGLGPPNYRGFTITDTPHSVVLLRTSDQPDAETSN